MAQTVSYSRGNSSIASVFNTASTTMYTNSSGYPQRIIIAGVGAQIASGQSPMSFFGLYLGIQQNGSTDARNIITVAYKLVSTDVANNISAIEMITGQNTQETQSFVNYPFTTLTNGNNRNTTGNTVSLVGQIAGQAPLGWTDYTNGLPNATGAMGSNRVNAISGGGYVFQYIPPQFWMSPGDVLIARTNAPTSIPGYLLWNLITIAES